MGGDGGQMCRVCKQIMEKKGSGVNTRTRISQRTIVGMQSLQLTQNLRGKGNHANNQSFNSVSVRKILSCEPPSGDFQIDV